MTNRSKPNEKPTALDRFQVSLNADHQKLIWFATLLGLVLVASFFLAGRFSERGWVDIDSAQPRAYQYQVDLNRASWIELSAIPGIGEITAKQIIAHRERCGGFSEVQQLLDVPGVGPKTLQKMHPFLLPVE